MERKKIMKRMWITTDTHFGHLKMPTMCDRPEDFSKRLLDGYVERIREDDILIHLGDFAFTDHEEWASVFFNHVPCKVWLIRGNHDKRSDFWYLDRGFSFIARSIIIKRFGYKVAFSHRPLVDSENFDVNIHGHFHNNDHRYCEPYLLDRLTPKHILLAVEWLDYKPVTLESVLDKNMKV